ncbi:anthranilate synthase component I [Peribacillus alkalitolerans]|uniref:anthranilate synthase component I n=1 Tax=Peribacillus alkalitolerans TaxID=1550385 RepID=UPI0013D331E7|nr:anthranilate synthase component I [Peribacillus alkalitolerans]
MKDIKLLRKDLEGDIHTPISIFQSLEGKKKFLLESSLKHEQNGRYSFIGADPFLELKSCKDKVLIQLAGEKEVVREGRFLDIVKEYLPPIRLDEAPFPFLGGGVGYIGYDLIRQYEEIGLEGMDELNMPDAHLMFYREVIVYDHFTGMISIVSLSHEDKRTFEIKATKIMNEITRGKEVKMSSPKKQSISFQPEISQQHFEKLVNIAKQEIIKGEIFQVVLSQRFTSEFAGDPFQFYRGLRRLNPSPYMFYVDFEDYQVVGSSPESLIKGDGTHVTTNPIAGTRKRGDSEIEDEALEKDLLQDEKEIAEHRMLIDLGRNDLGRVCEIGSIEISKYMLIEKYKYVMHIVSEVRGRKLPHLHNTDVLASCLPAGTVSGAPKIQAMRIINDLEGIKRNVYAGAVGYFSYHGSFDFALAIRTMVVKDGKAIIQAGAGIVYDSDPGKEYFETLNKARALMEVEA